MSGFLFSLRPLPNGVLPHASERLAYVEDEQADVVDAPPLAALSVRSDSEALWGAARDPATGVTVWLGGRTALDEGEWEAAARLPFEGGLAARHALAEFLEAPDSFPARQNGAFALVVWDPRAHALTVATDRMGFFPVYVWGEADRPVVASHPDVLAAAVGATDLDRVTMAEAVAFGKALPPYTYYTAVRELEPGSVYTWGPSGGPRVRAYWTPRYAADASARVGALADDLATAITTSVRRRTLPRLGRPALLLSGGADSRAVLYAACEPSAVTSVTLYSEPNAELATARALAERAGSPHVALQRSFEHYGLGAPEAVRITGGMWNFRDAHYTALLPEIDALGADTVLTGCYADYLFKGLTSDRTPRTLLGRALPLYAFAPYSDWWYVHPGPLDARHVPAVRARRDAHFDGTDRAAPTDEARWALELRRIRPVAREADTASRLLLQRAMRWDPIFADTALVEMYERVPPSLKLNGQVWERAVAQVCREAGDVQNNNTQARIGVSDTRKVAAFLYGVAYRKVVGRDVDGSALDGTASRGSWPNFPYYIRHSTVLPELWASGPPETDEVLADVLAEPVGGRSMAEWMQTNGTQAATRLLTLRLWLNERLAPPT